MKTVVIVIILTLVLICLSALLLVWLWAWIIPVIFPILVEGGQIPSEISFWTAFWLGIFIKVLRPGFSSNS